MKDKCQDIENKLHSHLSQYAENNKELKRLGDIMERQKEIIERQNRVDKDQERKIDEMYQVFTASNWTLKMTLRIFGGIGITTGMILGIIELIKKINR